MKRTPTKSTFGTLLISVCVVTPILRAQKGPTDLLADQSDAIVVARVQSGQQTGPAASMVLSISRLVKGDLSPGAVISVSATVASARTSATRTLTQMYGLWFLTRRNGQWISLPVIQGGASLETAGYIPLLATTSPAAVSSLSPPVSSYDQIALELAAALQAYTDPSQIYPLALHLSGISASTTLPSLYSALRLSPDPETKFVGLAGLLGTGDQVSALAEIAANVDAAPRLHTRSLIAIQISGTRNPDPSVIQSLNKIASSTDPSMQRAAAMGLENIHSQAALPSLAQLLDSNDPVAREAAMSGLSRFVDSLPIQTTQNTLNGRGLLAQGPTPYRTPETDKYSLSRRPLSSANEAEYLQFWKSWWAAVKSKLAPGQ